MAGPVGSVERRDPLRERDPLTGLPGRAAFDRRLKEALVAARAAAAPLALLFIDLDRFRRVNESLGHPAGDGLLRVVAARIGAQLHAGDCAARFGSDEFLVLLAAPADADAVRRTAEALRDAISEPVTVDGRTISVTPSIGIAIFPRDATTAELLVQHADSAMNGVKSRGRAAIGFFDVAAPPAALARLVLESELADALAAGQFELHFQPQVGARDGRVQGAEALIRWRHPERGLLGPDAFIPLAEERQLMLPIGQWVLREAARCATRWRDAGLQAGAVAVNLSSIQFQSIGFVEAVADVLPDAGVTPEGGAGLIELEITERMLMDDVAQVKLRLARLKAMGLRISIDDFGTGYSSLAHLLELPVDKLKMDRLFVRDLPGSARAATLARAIIDMGRGLGMTVIAEGVETDAQRRFLGENGCDQLQGLLIGAPMPCDAYEAWLRAGRVTAPA